MPRPCEADHELSPEKCRLCFLYAHDPQYRALWDGLPVAEVPRRLRSCIHLGAATGAMVECPSCKGRVRLKVHGCALHGEAVLGNAAGGLHGCQDCPDYAPSRLVPKAGQTRHLLYHVYPRLDSRWRQRVLRLRERIGLFNGKKVIAIAHDGTTNHPPMVKDALSGCGCEFIEVPNNPQLREVATFEPLFERVASGFGEGDVTLYAQAKGTTRPADSTADRWAHAMEELCLEYWPVVEYWLKRFPVVGPFKKVGRGWPDYESRESLWHYSGSWFWFRNKDLFSKPDWRRIDRCWTGIEPYPSLHFPSEDAVALCFERPVPTTNLYSHAFWQDVVDPALARFREEYADKRTVGEKPPEPQQTRLRETLAGLLRETPVPRIFEVGTRRWSDRPTIHRDLAPHASEYLGVDLSDGEDVDLVADVHELSKHLPANAYDGGVCIYTLEHLARPWLAVKEMTHCLKPGGLLYLETHQTFVLHDYPADYFRFSADALKVLCEDAGCEVVETDYAYPCWIDPYQNPELRWGEPQPPAWLTVACLAKKREANV